MIIIISALLILLNQPIKRFLFNDSKIEKYPIKRIILLILLLLFLKNLQHLLILKFC